MQEQRFSYQREQIYQSVRASRLHPTAEMVYHHLKPQLPRLSLGTVYRNLHRMAQEGLLTELDGPVTRFDAEVKPHAHFRCGHCGELTDLDDLDYDAALDCRAAQGGRVVTGHALIFNGLCPACAGHDKTPNESIF
ncbi:MAG: transcriptional repressor [Oscillibacter sp.]